MVPLKKHWTCGDVESPKQNKEGLVSFTRKGLAEEWSYCSKPLRKLNIISYLTSDPLTNDMKPETSISNPDSDNPIIPKEFISDSKGRVPHPKKGTLEKHFGRCLNWEKWRTIWDCKVLNFEIHWFVSSLFLYFHRYVGHVIRVDSPIQQNRDSKLGNWSTRPIQTSNSAHKTMLKLVELTLGKQNN